MSLSLRRRLIVGVAAVLVSFLVTSLAPMPALARPIEEAVREAGGVRQMIGERRSPTENAPQIKGLRAEIKGALVGNAPAYKLADLHEQILRLGVDDAPTRLWPLNVLISIAFILPMVGLLLSFICFCGNDTDQKSGPPVLLASSAAGFIYFTLYLELIYK